MGDLRSTDLLRLDSKRAQVQKQESGKHGMFKFGGWEPGA